MRATIGRQIEKDIGIRLSDLVNYAEGETPLPVKQAREKLWNLETLKIGTDSPSSLSDALRCQVPNFYKALEDKTHPSHPLVSLLDTAITAAIDRGASKITPEVQKIFQEKYKDDGFQFPVDTEDLENQKTNLEKIAGDYPDKLSRQIFNHVATDVVKQSLSFLVTPGQNAAKTASDMSKRIDKIVNAVESKRLSQTGKIDSSSANVTEVGNVEDKKIKRYSR